MKNIIFDLDGTIIDSSECIFSIYRQLFAEIGIKIPPESVLRTFIGPPVEYVVKDYVEKEKTAAVCNRFRELYNSVDLMEVNKLYDGITDLLRTLVDNEKKLYIATTKNEFFAKKIIDGFGIMHYFNGVYGSRFDLGRLTKAQVIEEVISANGLSKAESILIGDTHFDVEGAMQVGISAAIVNYGFGDKQKLKEYPVLFYSDTPMDVASRLL